MADPVLTRLHPEWSRPIQDFGEDESILLKPEDEIFSKNRSELAFLAEAMSKFGGPILRGNNAVARMRLIEQMKVVEAYSEFQRRHELNFNPAQGVKLVEWLRANGNPAITIVELENAYRHLTARPIEPEPKPPTIGRQPSDVSVAPGELATFEVVAEGSQPLSYEWSINAMLIPGEAAKRPRYSTLCTERTDGALFKVRVSNSHGAVFSWPALLTMKK